MSQSNGSTPVAERTYVCGRSSRLIELTQYFNGVEGILDATDVLDEFMNGTSLLLCEIAILGRQQLGYLVWHHVLNAN